MAVPKFSLLCIWICLLVHNGWAVEEKNNLKDEAPPPNRPALNPNPRQPENSKYHVAFAVARTTPLGPVSEVTTITYDTILVNMNNGFKPFNSHFIAPFKGLYFFASQIRGNNMASVEIKVNGVGQVRARAAVGGHAATSCALPLERGDSVWSDLKPTWDAYIWSTSEKFVTFSGFMIAYLEEE